MYLSHLSLTNFRNYVRLELDLSPGIILFQGNNAQGKTNLLESIYYLATTRSPHTRSDRQLINWLAEESEPLPFARLDATVQRQGSPLRVEITLLKPPEGPGGFLRKRVRVNGVNRRALDLLGQVNVVLFLPEDIELVAGSPSRRRAYLDATLCQVNAVYCHALSQYNHILTQRNALLRELRERGGGQDQLLFWDESLAVQGALLISRRRAALAELDLLVMAQHRELTGGQERLRLRYLPSFAGDSSEVSHQLPLGLQESGAGTGQGREQIDEIAACFRERLRQLRREEIARSQTTIGPHRDDFQFLVDGVDLNVYGSRGQQRTATLSLKLAEVAFMVRVVGERPVLLLDDVMSELDAARREYLEEVVAADGQVVLTTTDWDNYSPQFRAGARLLQVQQGIISSPTLSPDPSPS
jgi:DNA replication and repair protein RecF